MCAANLANGDISISAIVVVDGGFTEDLILQQSDIVKLQVGNPTSCITMSMANGSVVSYNIYPPVTMTLTLTDGTFVQANLIPQVLVRPPDEEPMVEREERLVGYNGMFKLGLKQDFRNHKLVRRTRRV